MLQQRPTVAKKFSKNKKAEEQKQKKQKQKTHKWDYIKLKGFAEQGKQSTNWKSNQMNKRKYLQIMYLIKVCLSVCMCAQSCPTVCDPLDRGVHQTLLSMGFFRKEHWNGLPILPLGDLSDPGIELLSPVSCTAGGFGEAPFD